MKEPVPEQLNDTIIDEKKYKRAREFFFNPASSMIFFLLLVAIGAIIKAANPFVFVDAAATLAIMQTVFASIAALMLVIAVVSLTVHAVSSLVEWGAEKRREKQYISLDELDHRETEKPVPYTPNTPRTNGYIQYFDEKIIGWKNLNPKWGNFLYFVTAGGVLAALTYTIGYCVDPVGVFSFMEPFFSFVGGMFTQGVQSAGALSGLDALASLSGPVLQLMGNIFAGVVLVSAAIFIPDLLRQLSPKNIDKWQLNDQQDMGSYTQMEGGLGSEFEYGQAVKVTWRQDGKARFGNGIYTFKTDQFIEGWLEKSGNGMAIIRTEHDLVYTISLAEVEVKLVPNRPNYTHYLISRQRSSTCQLDESLNTSYPSGTFGWGGVPR